MSVPVRKGIWVLRVLARLMLCLVKRLLYFILNGANEETLGYKRAQTGSKHAKWIQMDAKYFKKINLIKIGSEPMQKYENLWVRGIGIYCWVKVIQSILDSLWPILISSHLDLFENIQTPLFAAAKVCRVSCRQLFHLILQNCLVSLF